MYSHLGQGGLDAGHVIGPGARGAVDQVGAVLAAAHQAVPLPGGFVDALVTIPDMFLFDHHIIAF